MSIKGAGDAWGLEFSVQVLGGFTVEARKLEHQCPHALKVKHRES